MLSSKDLNATVFLPPGSSSPTSQAYYRSTRFDWGSMVGDIQFRGHVLMGSDFRRVPHSPESPEAGVGLAAEFGCVAEDATCGAGWGVYGTGSANGVLGYEEAHPGEPFLKIGVGRLVKGSCRECAAGDGTYRFNSSYAFAGWPTWDVARPRPSAVRMVHAAALGSGWGYQLSHRVEVDGRALTVETELQNIGGRPFRTPWYSHNFLSVDGQPLGKDWQVEFPFDCRPFRVPTWSSPSANWLEVQPANVLRPTSGMPERVAIGLEFEGGAARGQEASGAFRALLGRVADRVTVSSELVGGPSPLFSYGLRAELRTLSPMPSMMISLGPGERSSWQQVLTFE